MKSSSRRNASPKETTDVVNDYQRVRTRERAVHALHHRRLEAGVEIDHGGTALPRDPPRRSREARYKSLTQGVLSRGYGPSDDAGQRWHEGGIGVEIAWWRKRATLHSPSVV